ncbi:DUF1579 domain-containing protein [Gemmata sp.]|uniref:DUF1579 domain-containing protein n=1 Tax=Gemmata sp. TaxID=1914242 RepID=UPI003F7300AB
MKLLSTCAVVLALTAPVHAQSPAKPGPEHDVLKKMEGNWDMTMKFGGMEAKGTVVYKMELGGLWLAGALETELFGSKFSGRSLDSYDAAKKKYVGVWVDSMSASTMVLEGTFDAATKTLTMTGDGPGQDGKPTKHKAVSVMPDDDTINFSMFMGDTKEPMFTIVYKRKK